MSRAHAKNGGNLLGGLNGDNMDDHDGDENIAMDDDGEYDWDSIITIENKKHNYV